MTAEHTHHWQVDRMQVGFSCPCGQNGWDWHVDEVNRLTFLHKQDHSLANQWEKQRDEARAQAAVLTAQHAADLTELKFDLAELHRLRAELQAWQQRFGDCEATVLRMEADAETWRHMWNDADLMAFRAEALRDGTADLGGGAVPQRAASPEQCPPGKHTHFGKWTHEVRERPDLMLDPEPAASPEPTAP